MVPAEEMKEFYAIFGAKEHSRPLRSASAQLFFSRA